MIKPWAHLHKRPGLEYVGVIEARVVHIFHYTHKSGFNGIRSQPTWTFLASEPPCENPVGAYFTNLDKNTPLLARKLGISREKLEFIFSFADVGDLRPLRGDRGRFIFYSPDDYRVGPDRKIDSGTTGHR